jgi:putative ABC transport system permease protein
MASGRIARNVVLGVKNLTLHKLRSALTMLGVVFGVGSVIAMLAVGEGASEETIAQIRKLGSHNIIITSQKPVEETTATQRTFLTIYGLLYEDERRLRETFESVRRTVPIKLIRQEGRIGSRSLELRIVATTPDWFELVQRPLIAGRRLVERDIEDRGNSVVLTEYGARRLLAAENLLGENLRLGGQYFEVVGIVQSESGQSGDLQTPDQEVDAYIETASSWSFTRSSPRSRAPVMWRPLRREWSGCSVSSTRRWTTAWRFRWRFCVRPRRPSGCSTSSSVPSPASACSWGASAS